VTRAGIKLRTREDLLTAARELIAEGGVASATVEAISRRAGVTKGAFYYSFASKEALLADVAKSLRVYVVPPETDLSTVTSEDLASGLRAAVAESRDALLLQFDLWLYATRNPDLKKVLRKAVRESRMELAERLSGTPDPSNAALAGQSLLIGLSMLMLLDDSLTADELAHVLGDVTAAERADHHLRSSSRRGRNGSAIPNT
jgi:AcrR family transcriptional regulator